MKNLTVILLLSAATLCPSPVSAQSLLPKPREVAWHEGVFKNHEPYAVEASSPHAARMALEAGLPALAPQTAGGTRALRYSLLRKAANPEAYRLRVTPDTIEIAATTPAGFRYAKATLRQLQTKKGVACCTIADEPAMEWRGAMLDVSRHFFPLSFIKKQIDVLARYKFNRLHLHLTDAAGWRMEIKRYPRLTQFAAWRTDSLWKTWWDGGRMYVDEGTPGAYGGYYTQEQLRHLVDYARERGITIVPEIEMPAHSEEVTTAYPELSCTHEPYKQPDFCPGNEATYTFLENVLREVMDVFPSTDIHIGGDEAGKASWRTCPLCLKRMQEEGLESTDALQGYLIRRIARFLEAEGGRRMIGWDEVLADSLAPGATVLVWRDTSSVRQAVERGHDVILAPGKFCYLDGYQDNPPTQPEAMGGYLPLSKVYSYNPSEGLDPAQRKRVRGIQGNLWVEYISTEAGVEYMLYPRLLAIAETGWTGGIQKDYADFKARALAEVDSLHKAGVNAFDLKREVGDRPESKVAVNHKARGAKVTYNAPYDHRYPADGETSLTDGRRGGWDYGPSTAWQGFVNGDRIDVTIDLGKAQKIKRVTTNFYQSPGPWIYVPTEYKLSVSTDGTSFTTLKDLKQPLTKFVNPSVEPYTWKGKSTARYIRIQSNVDIPGGWLFIDEVEVY